MEQGVLLGPCFVSGEESGPPGSYPKSSQYPPDREGILSIYSLPEIFGLCADMTQYQKAFWLGVHTRSELTRLLCSPPELRRLSENGV